MEQSKLLSREELYDASFPWTIVDGRVYNLATFMPKHPGGVLICRAVGEDASALFHTHHTGRRAAVELARLEIGRLRDPMPKPDRKSFQEVLNERIVGLEKAPSTAIAEVIAVVLLILFGGWAVLAYCYGWWRLNVALAWFWWRHLDSGLHSTAHGDFRYNAAWQRLLFNVYSIITRKSVEYYAGNPSLCGFGMSKHMWHHVYTNNPDCDPDWATMTGCPWVRRHKSATWRPFHADQHRYWILVTMTIEPFLEFVQAAISCLEALAALLEVPAEAAPPLPQRLAIVAWVWIEFLLNPGYQGAAFLFQPWWRALGVVTIARAVSRLVLFPFSEVQHYMPEHVDAMDTVDGAKEEWAITQLRQTANLRLEHPIARLLDFLMFHGDSFQIEHHLWPAMSFVNLRAASRIVKGTCLEFGVPYHEIGYWEGYRRIWQQVSEHAVAAVEAASKIREDPDDIDDDIHGPMAAVEAASTFREYPDDIDDDIHGPMPAASPDNCEERPRKRFRSRGDGAERIFLSSPFQGEQDTAERAPRRRRLHRRVVTSSESPSRDSVATVQ